MSRSAFLALALVIACPLALRGQGISADEIVRGSGARAGLAVHLGSTDGKLEIDLAGRGFRYVHGLAFDESASARARQAIQGKGLYGVGAVEAAPSWPNLPYADNLVNLLVADIDALADRGVKPPAEREMVRVLAPGGVAYRKQAGRWTKTVKPRPAEMGDWTHPFSGPDESRTSRDGLVGVPAGVQWLAGPIYAVAGRKSSTESMVSAGGRVFILTQNERSNLDAEAKVLPNYLMARDAFNGLLLWQRTSKNRHLGKSGAVNPRLVATDRLLFTVEDEQVVALDAASGELVRKYPTSSFPEKFLFSNGLLIVETKDGVTAFAADSGQKKWGQAGSPAGTAADDRLVSFFETARDEPRALVVLELQSGKPLWRKRVQDGGARLFSKSYLEVAFLHPECIGLISQELVMVLSATDGKELWSRKIDRGYGLAYLSAGLVWVLDGSDLHGLDLRTGAAKQKVPSPGKVDMCQPHLATANLVIDPRHPAVVDLRTGQKTAFDFTRGGCGTGFVAANGLLYTTPNACACYRDALRGFVAATSTRRSAQEATTTRLEKGPADADLKPAKEAVDDNWPTYRRDAARSAWTASAIGPKVSALWKIRVGEPVPAGQREEWELRSGAALTAPVVAGGRVFLANPNLHRMAAFDAATGQAAWQFTAGGRIDSPPTIAGGLCLFGCRDGWVYALRADDGQLAWRFRAAPVDQRIVAYGQLESVWPVLGSVLVHDGVAYASAGRTSGADGGFHVHALEPHTGRALWSRTINRSAKGGLPDLLVSGGTALCIAGHELDWKTGADRDADDAYLRGGPAGLLEASWTRIPLGLRKGIQTWSHGKTTGQLLAFAPGSVWGYDTNSTGKTIRKSDDVVFATGAKSWKVQLPSPLQGEALIAAGNQVIVAGVKDRDHRDQGGFLRILAASDGKLLLELPLPAAPVYDGLAAARGQLYVATEDGQLHCFGK